MEIKKQYDKLRFKYALPDYDEINLLFDIEDIDAESALILQNIRKKIDEKIKKILKIFEMIVQPETNLKDMYEAKYISDKNRELAYALFKKLMSIKRNSELISINNTNKENAKFIKETFETYNMLKPELFEHVERLKNAWNKNTNIKNELSYFG